MTVRVLKFGGSSVGGESRLPLVLSLIEAARAEGTIAVVVSAMSDTTDDLLAAVERATIGDIDGAMALASSAAALVRTRALQVGVDDFASLERVIVDLIGDVRRVLEGVSLLGESSARARDRVLSFGERASARAVAAALRARKVDAEAIDATGWMTTNDRHGAAVVDVAATQAKVDAARERWLSRVTIHTGFLGATHDGYVTTLGRNGSDYTATLLARALGAESITLWTDVSGVYTADPSLVAEAAPVARLTYREALELSALGLGMLHPRTMEPLIAGGIPLRVRNVARPSDEGTTIDARGTSDERHPACVVSREELVLFGIESAPGGAPVGQRASVALAEAGIDVLLETQTAGGMGTVVVFEQKQLPLASRALEVALPPGATIEVQKDVSLLTLVAEAMGKTTNVAGRFFGALGAVGINVRASGQGATARSISAVVDDADLRVAVRTVHAAFHLARAEANVLVLGKGVVGAQLLSQIASQQDTLARDHDVHIRVVGLRDSERSVFDEQGMDPAAVTARLSPSPREELEPLLDRLRMLPIPVLVDCTAADGMEQLYEQALVRGIHVVAANKKVFAGPRAIRDRVFASARGAHRALRYETTVGAALPILETLKNLVRTGDRVVRVEGSLSGTLGFLCQEVGRGVDLEAAVRDARERGFTEPHPREDLSGVDAARKALILARELGVAADLPSVRIEPFVPAALLEEADPERFLRSLGAHAPVIAARVEALRKEGRVLRYLATVDLRGPEPQLSVGPVGVPQDHPAAQLRGSEAFVAFTTARYQEYPLTVRGAGAGGVVTASGVLADVIAVAQGLRG